MKPRGTGKIVRNSHWVITSGSRSSRCSSSTRRWRWTNYIPASEPLRCTRKRSNSSPQMTSCGLTLTTTSRSFGGGREITETLPIDGSKRSNSMKPAKRQPVKRDERRLLHVLRVGLRERTGVQQSGRLLPQGFRAESKAHQYFPQLCRGFKSRRRSQYSAI
jgi:hypothetical protein